MLKNSAEFIQAECSDLPSEDLRRLNILSQESLGDDTESFFASMNKVVQLPDNTISSRHAQTKTKKERQTWRKKAASPDVAAHGKNDMPFKRSIIKEKEQAKGTKTRDRYDEQVIDLRNQIQLSESKRMSLASNGTPY